MGNEFRQLSRTIAYALRHHPEKFGLELDEHGWVPLDALLAALRTRRPQWAHLSQQDIRQLIATSTKKRFEMAEGKIRALYGHSVPGRIYTTSQQPPEVLYHGTPPKRLESIRRKGLLPMGRQYVHLSPTVERAIEVGRRRAQNPCVLVVLARKAYEAGVGFYQADPHHWLSDPIPPAFICFDRSGQVPSAAEAEQ